MYTLPSSPCRHSAGGQDTLVGECIACATEASLSEAENTRKMKQVLEEYLRNRSLSMVSVPGEGHCILHSVQVGLQSAGCQSLSSQSILDKAVDEIVENISFYAGFADGDIMEQLAEYQSLGNYQSTVGDMMLFALANAFKMRCIVLYVQDGKVRTTTILPRNNQTSIDIQVCKMGAHYEGVSRLSHNNTTGNCLLYRKYMTYYQEFLIVP